MKAAVSRRNYVLDRMADGPSRRTRRSRQKRARSSREASPRRRPRSRHFTELASASKACGAKAALESGLAVRTGIDPVLQRAANVALDVGLRKIDHLRGYRKATRNVGAEAKTINAAKLSQWTHDPIEGEYVPAIVTGIDAKVIQVRLAKWHGAIDPKGYEWTRKKAEDAVKKGDVVDVRIKKVDAKNQTFTPTRSDAGAQGSVVAIDNHTGRSWRWSADRTSSAPVQPRHAGERRSDRSSSRSVCTTAIDGATRRRRSLTSRQLRRGPQPRWPKNYDRIRGRNHAALGARRLAQRADRKLMAEVGPERWSPWRRRWASRRRSNRTFDGHRRRRGNLLEMVAAYVAFPNQGVHDAA
jgi:hypothetical protein